mgnify:FL=1
MTDNVYGPARRFCDEILTKFNIETTYYDPLIGSKIKELIKPNTVLIYTEAPGSQTFEMSDIPAIAKEAQAKEITVIMDNTWASAMYFNAFEKGVDIVVEAVTKYICGHSDVMMGVIVSKCPDWEQKTRSTSRNYGNASGPDLSLIHI